MDAKEQIIYTLKKEIHLLKVENEYLKVTCAELNGGKQIQIPQNLSVMPMQPMQPMVGMHNQVQGMGPQV
jgi:hypothetical protein